MTMLTTAFDGVPYAVIGAVAANAYMPARQTQDIDVAIATQDGDRATALLLAAGWTRLTRLTLREPLRGWAWQTPATLSVDVIEVPGNLGTSLVAAATVNQRDGEPTATLPHLVTLKLFAGRASDAGDITRMLGHQDALTLETVRSSVKTYLTRQDLEDLDQLIDLGKLEYGERRKPEPPTPP